MFVTSLEITRRVNGECESKVLQHPSWNDVIEAVERLDGNAHDGVVLNAANGSYLGIVGGHDGRFVVAGRRLDGKPFILRVGQTVGMWIAVTVGGQDNEYGDNEVVAMDTALVVARTFFESGKCDDRYQWSETAARMSAT